MPAIAVRALTTPAPSERSARITWVYAGLALVAAAVTYGPIVRTYFWADDFYGLYRMRNDPLLEFVFKPQGGHLLATTYAIFWVSNLLFGPNPLPYFIGVVALHLLNVLLLFAVVRRITGSDMAACFGALLWGVCPTHDGSLGWYSVFGHVVLGTIVLWLLYDLTGVERTGTVSRGMRVRWAVLLLAGATSFGIGIGIALVFPLIVLLLVPHGRGRAGAVAVAAGTAATMPFLYVGLHRLFSGRPLGMEIPSEIGVGSLVVKFGPQLVVLILHLAGYGIASTVLGTLWPDAPFPAPFAIAVVAVFLIGLILAFVGGSGRTRRYLLAALVLMLGSYGMVVAGRVAFYAPHPQLANAPRYQYVPSMAIVLCLSLMVRELGRRVPLPYRWSVALLGIWTAATLGARLAYGRPLDPHLAARRETAHVVDAIRAAIATVPPDDAVYLPTGSFNAIGPFRSHTLFPGWAGVFVIFFPDNAVDGRRVYFVEPDARALKAAARGRRSATLLVPDRGDARGVEGGAAID